MKTYVKPTVDVVKLSVKENMAALPTGITEGTPSTYTYNGNAIDMTVYDLTKASPSVQI